MNFQRFVWVPVVAAAAIWNGCSTAAPINGYTLAEWNALPKEKQERLLTDRAHRDNEWQNKTGGGFDRHDVGR